MLIAIMEVLMWGRYNKDGTGIPHKGKMPPRIPNSEIGKFSAAASKLRCVCGILGWLPGILDDISRLNRARENGRSYSEQMQEETKDIEFFITPIGIMPNPYYKESSKVQLI